MFGVFDKNSAKKRLDELTERCEKLERDMRALNLEWEQTYDKVRQMMGRIAKRAEALHDTAEASGKLFPGDSSDAVKPPVPLTPRQRLIQQQVADRRRMNGGGE